MAHIAESLHWYARDGSPCYTVKAKDGSDRPTTLRDARKLSLVPSVTAIIRCAAAPGLEVWKQQQVLLSALTLTRLDSEAEAAYLQRIVDDSKEQGRKAAQRGTDIHAAIQGYLSKETIDKTYERHVFGTLKEIDEQLGVDWDCAGVERAFAHALGFGGKVDLFCTAPDLVLDFKTKEFGPTDDLKTWDEHAMQIAAYREGMDFRKARGAICYVSVTHPGLARVIEITPDELAKGWRMFYSLLHYWQAKTGYASAFERIAA